VVKVYLNPADPTLPSPPQGMSSYAANAMVFGRSPHLNRLTDGTSNTVGYAEHYAYSCGGREFSWAIDATPFPFSPPNKDGVSLLRATTFADKDLGDVYPVTEGNPPASRGSVPGLTFQVRPKPSECDPRIAQTPHRGGMLVAFMDGGVRTLSAGMSESAYWSAVTPSGGEVQTAD
jgi:hypothetical protein